MKTRRLASYILTLIFTGMIIFQLLLAFGIPLGRAAWGAQHKVLPLGLRIASLIAVLVFIYATVVVLQKGGVISIIKSQRVTNISIWFFTIYFALNVLTNLTSPGQMEKWVMAPLALISSGLCFLLALSKESDAA